MSPVRCKIAILLSKLTFVLYIYKENELSDDSTP